MGGEDVDCGSASRDALVPSVLVKALTSVVETAVVAPDTRFARGDGLPIGLLEDRI